MLWITYKKHKTKGEIYEEKKDEQEAAGVLGCNHAVLCSILPFQRGCRRESKAERHKENHQCGRNMHCEVAEQQEKGEMVCIEQKYQDHKQEQQTGKNQGCQKRGIISKRKGREQDL